MMFLDLFPIGLYQLSVVLQEGLWYARSQEVIMGTMFSTFTYFRSIGILVFVIGGVVPLVWFILSRGNKMKETRETEEVGQEVYEQSWAAQKEE